jgi:peptide/nickel transport system substrate-binding protein
MSTAMARFRLVLLASVLGQALVSAPVAAATAVIGTRVGPTSLDPQLGGLQTDQGYYQHLYDALFARDELLRPVPALAVSFRRIDELTWEFKLRTEVEFHDGSAFDANDVLFTYRRLGTVEGSDGLQAQKMRPVKRIEVVDTHTLRMVTDAPTPKLLTQLTDFWIISDSIDPASTTEDFNRGRAIGTGPFRLVEWRRGDQLVLNRFDRYWGQTADFERVVIKEMTNDATRVAALQAGDVDLIDYVPPLDTYRLNRMSNVKVYVAPSARVIFIQFDTLSRMSRQVRDHAGRGLPVNPLSDNRVRQALKLAISKDLIVEKILENLAVPANQGVPEGFEGFNPDIPPDPFDPAGARRLLTEAGYPRGFGITLSCPNDRYINDAIVCQAIGQLWTQVGVRTQVETMPKSVYFKKLLAGELSAYMLGWGNSYGDSMSLLTSVIYSRDNDHGWGTWNASYSDPDLDRSIDEAITTMDPGMRERRLQAIMARVVADNAIVPLYVQPVIAASARQWRYTPAVDEQTLAISLRFARDAYGAN